MTLLHSLQVHTDIIHSVTSCVSLHWSVSIVWHRHTCPTNFHKSLEWSPDSVWDDQIHQRSSYHLLEGHHHWVTERFLSLLPGRVTVCHQQSLLRQPCTILSSPENSSVHRFVPTIFVTLSAFRANVTCLWQC